MDIANNLGELLKSIRQANGIKINEVAEATGLSISYISRLEGGSRTNPTIDVLVNLSKFYHVDLFKLVIGELCFDNNSTKVLNIEKELDQCENVIIHDKLVRVDKFKNLLDNIYSLIN